MSDFAAILRETIVPSLLGGDSRMAPESHAKMATRSETGHTTSDRQMPFFIEAYPLQWHTYFEWFWVLTGRAR